MFIKFKCIIPLEDGKYTKQDLLIHDTKNIILMDTKLPSDLLGPDGNPVMVNGTKALINGLPFNIDENIDDVEEKLK